MPPTPRSLVGSVIRNSTCSSRVRGSVVIVVRFLLPFKKNGYLFVSVSRLFGKTVDIERKKQSSLFLSLSFVSFPDVLSAFVGYQYCHSCSDYQALMPRSGAERGYDPMNVCAFCIELLSSELFWQKRIIIIRNTARGIGLLIKSFFSFLLLLTSFFKKQQQQQQRQQSLLLGDIK